MKQAGRELRHAREGLGLSIDDISQRTKIKPHLLQAIEAGDIARLPGGLYARGLLRGCWRGWVFAMLGAGRAGFGET